MKKKLLAGIIFAFVLVFAGYSLFLLRFVSRKQEKDRIEAFSKSLREKNGPEAPSTLPADGDKKSVQGVLYVPAIDLELPLYKYSGQYALTYGAGILQGDLSAKKGQHSIVTSHNGEILRDLFTNLIRLKKGQHFYIKNEKNEILDYRIIHILQVSPKGEISTFLMPGDRNLFTLRTCTPAGINIRRLHVTGVFEGFIQEDQIPKGSLTLSNFEIFLLFASVLSLFGLGKSALQIRRELKKKKRIR